MTWIRWPFLEPMASDICLPMRACEVQFSMIWADLFTLVTSKCALTNMHPSFTKLYDYSSISFVANVPCKLSTANITELSIFARSHNNPPSARFSL